MKKIIDIKYIILLLLVVVVISCAPKRNEYTHVECFLASDCLYRLRNAPDKSPCSHYIDMCCKRMDEAAYRERLEYCRKAVKDCSGADCLTFRECIK